MIKNQPQKWRLVLVYNLAAVGLVIFSLDFFQYACGDYKSFIKDSAWKASNDYHQLSSVFAASAIRFTFRLSYVTSFIGLLWRRRAAVYLCLIAWLGQLIPATIYALGNHGDLIGSLTSFIYLLVYLVLIALCWPALKPGRAILFCSAGLGAALILHTALFAFLWSSSAPARETNDPVKQAQFMQAVENGDATIVKSMLADHSFHPALRGPNCNFNTICNLISYAVDEKGSVEVVQALQQAGSPIDEQDGSSGDTPLMRALFSGRIDIAEYLASNGANPWKTNHFHMPEFMVAAGEGSPKLLEIMIEKNGPEVVNLIVKMPDMIAGEKARDENGKTIIINGVTPLMLAGFSGRLDLIKTLLTHGGDVSLADEKGRRIYDYIAAGKQPDMADAVRELVNNP